jgi:hypothetical protein
MILGNLCEGRWDVMRRNFHTHRPVSQFVSQCVSIVLYAHRNRIETEIGPEMSHLQIKID